jgi:hypothetical protein
VVVVEDPPPGRPEAEELPIGAEIELAGSFPFQLDERARVVAAAEIVTSAPAIAAANA